MDNVVIVNRIYLPGRTELVVEHHSPEVSDREQADRLLQALEVFSGYWTPDAVKHCVQGSRTERSTCKKVRRHGRESIRFIHAD